MLTESLRTIELLSLQERQGRYWMELAMEQRDGRVILERETDKKTYDSLMAIHPFDVGKARLSFRHGWDPFRKAHYGVLIKTNRLLSEPHYFDCSEAYVRWITAMQTDTIQSLQSGDHEPLPIQSESSSQLPCNRISEARSTISLLKPKSYRSMGRVVFLVILFFFAWFGMENAMLRDSYDAYPNSSREELYGDSSGYAFAQTVIEVNTADDSMHDSDETKKNGETVSEELLPGQENLELEASELEDPELPYAVIELETGKPYYSLPKGYVALTFDDGPSEYTKDIVDVLNEHEVGATFLFVGRQASKYPDEAKYASDHGMAIGNHSWDHSDLTKKTAEEQKENVSRAGREIAERTEDTSVTLFRPPYGASNTVLEQSLEELDLKLLMWNRDPKDWKANHARSIVNYFKELSPSGGIYVLHEKKATLEALPEIIAYIKEQELTFAVFR